MCHPSGFGPISESPCEPSREFDCHEPPLHAAFAKWHDHKRQIDLRRDEDGLTMLAYALGAAVIIVPLASAVFLFAQGAVNDAANEVDTALAAA